MESSRRFVECEGLGRELPGAPGKVLLEGVTFQVAPGEVLAITGPSGAGKSSLLRLLNRLDEPSRGEILFQGRSYRAFAPRELRRRVGMVMQRPFLFPGTVSANLAFGPAQCGRELAQEKIEALLAQAGLGGYGPRTVETLSGGEAQRVAIARALANEPDLLLLDEPTSSLDEEAKLNVEQMVGGLIRERGLTCIWVTHDAAQARRMASRALMLQGGRMCGSARTALSHA